MALSLFIDRIDTPIGKMLLVADQDGNLRAMDWAESEARTRSFLQLHYGEAGLRVEEACNPSGLSHALNSYFGGNLHAIDSLSVQAAGTSFQQEVWWALREIPCGTTISYAQLAKQIGRPKAVRAVGLANGSNPVPIVVPCHRVIGSDGSLTGYGGGMERKRWLLEHEKCLGAGSQKRFSYGAP
jgi:methylated-DNA-[protein]-cysteine S-methyltransferase